MRLAVIDLDWLEKGCVDLAASDHTGQIDKETGFLIKLVMVKMADHISKTSKPIGPHIDLAFKAGFDRATSEYVENVGAPDLETYKKNNNYVDV